MKTPTSLRESPQPVRDAVPMPAGGLVRYRDHVPWWVIPVLAICTVLALSGAALGATALLSSPSKVAGPAGPRGMRGPQGPRGLTGAQGPAGAEGPAGPKGATGPAGPQGQRGPTGAQGPAGPAGPKGATGPPGPTGATGAQGAAGATGAKGASGATGGAAIASARVVKPLADVSAPDAAVGSTLAGTASCAAGQVLLSGGGQVTAPGIAENHVGIRSSYPLNSTTWQVVAIVNAPLGNGVQMMLQPFAVCGSR